MLIIEDGSIVANANSYITDLELTDYADLRGTSYPTLSADREFLIIKAMDYLNTFEYAGIRSEAENQLLDFPRYSIWVNERYIQSNEIPREIKYAQIEAALAYNTQELLINETVNNVQREKLDVLEVSYFSGGKNSKVRLDKVNHYLKPFLIDTDTLVRV